MDNSIVDAINDHTHAPAKIQVEVQKLRHGIKRKAIESQETPQQIISSAVINISHGAAGIIPPIRTIKRCIRRYRQNEGISHPIPLVASEMDIPEEFKITTHGKQFLLFDRVFPFVYALLSDKKEETYNTLFLQLKTIKIGLNPSHISVDFEQAAINAFRAFPL